MFCMIYSLRRIIYLKIKMAVVEMFHCVFERLDSNEYTSYGCCYVLMYIAKCNASHMSYLFWHMIAEWILMIFQISVKGYCCCMLMAYSQHCRRILVLNIIEMAISAVVVISVQVELYEIRWIFSLVMYSNQQKNIDTYVRRDVITHLVYSFEQIKWI